MKKIFIIAAVSIASLYMLFVNWDLVLDQVFRGKTEVDLSHRDEIFYFFITFIKENIFFGNFAQKLWYSPSFNELYHAHNSYLETLASAGLFLSIIILILVANLVLKNKNSIKFILPMLVYSLSQYGILWGVSFFDIIFFAILWNSNNIASSMAKTSTSNALQ
nr:hypothetical protein [Sphingobacterium pedocola]